MIGFGQTANDFFEKGNEYLEKEDYFNAELNYILSLELNEYNWLAYQKLAWIADRQGDWQGVINNSNKAKELNERDDYLYHAVARAYFQLNMYKEAINEYTIFLDRHKAEYEKGEFQAKLQFQWAYQERGLSYLYLGNKESACKDWQKESEIFRRDSRNFIKYCSE
ncbi:hypothetical protein OAW63_03995 [Flavobacteriaceae bacterium]|nr:hypothetical protein [Flavobacteriaceae bacterium]